jgi:hypothetical protein
VVALEDFTDADIAALEQAAAPESSKAFDDELNPWMEDHKRGHEDRASERPKVPSDQIDYAGVANLGPEGQRRAFRIPC